MAGSAVFGFGIHIRSMQRAVTWTLSDLCLVASRAAALDPEGNTNNEVCWGFNVSQVTMAA